MKRIARMTMTPTRARIAMVLVLTVCLLQFGEHWGFY
jgi:hypothetical protein